jgi:hypothetical protein
MAWRRPVATQEFCLGRGGGGQQIQLTVDRENRDLGAVVPYSGALQAAVIWYKKFHFLIFGTLRLFMMTTNLFVITNVKQLRTGGSFRNLLPFFPNILGCWRPKFSNF